MSISNLSSQYMSASFAGLVQYSSSNDVYDGLGNKISTMNVTASGTVAGSNGSIQYKSGSLFKGVSDFYYNESLSSLTVGSLNTAVGLNSIATGEGTVAKGQGSSTFGRGTVASGSYQAVFGIYNTGNSGSLLIVGNGSGTGARSNAFEVTPSGSIVLNPYQTGGTKPGRTGQNGEMIIVHDGSNPWLYIYLDVIGDWKGIQLTA